MKKIKIISISFLVILAFSCRKEVFIPGDRPADWTRESHSNNVEPDYGIVFNQNKVNKIHIVFTAQEWQDMQTNLQEVRDNGYVEQPSYFPADFYFNGKQWYEVGIRYKGNSSLKNVSNGKLPFKFNFDFFEDKFPEINNQRFYGFKNLVLGNGYLDETLMKDKTATDVFRHFGVPATRSAFYDVYIDKGDGKYQYFGSYTVHELVEDTFLKNYFGTETGNCYKPDGWGASFGRFGFSLDPFHKKNNFESTDKSDIQELYDVLHSSLRTSNRAQWKLDLEAVFDVDGFLKYLAVNNTIQNWDSYGRIAHNYYLYNDPKMGKFRWIVWDCNLAFDEGPAIFKSLSFEMNEVSNLLWPLIGYIKDDSDYKTTYKAYVKSFVNSTYTTARMNPIISSQQSLLTNSATNEESGYTNLTSGVSSFNTGVTNLITHTANRVAAGQAYAP